VHDDRRVSRRALILLGPRLQRQHGVLTVSQAEQDGVDRRALRELRSAGLLRPAQLHVLRCSLTPVTWESRAMEVQLAAGPAAALGRWSAARLHELVQPGTRATELDLVQPRTRNLRAVSPLPRRSQHLTPQDVVAVGGFRCTSVAWTIVDLACSAAPRSVERLAARAIAEQRVTQDELAAVVRRLRDVPGVPAARRLLGITEEVVPRSRSRPESAVARAAVAAGLPRPVVNHPVIDGAGRRRELDLAWPAWWVAVELDLHPTHGTTIGRRLDGRRQNDLVHDWTLLRFDEHDLAAGMDEVLRQVRQALLRAGWRP
jgi:hypothetical protein